MQGVTAACSRLHELHLTVLQREANAATIDILNLGKPGKRNKDCCGLDDQERVIYWSDHNRVSNNVTPGVFYFLLDTHT